MDAGDVERFRWRPDPDRPRAANAAAAAERAAQVAARVAAVPRERLALVLGGDCTTGVGTVAGLIARGDGPGSSTSTATPTSTSLRARSRARSTGWASRTCSTSKARRTSSPGSPARAPMLTAGRLAFLALAPVTPFEPAEIERRRPHVVGLDTAIADPEGAARAALAALDADVLAVHFDVDVLDFRDAPLAENTDRAPGLPLASAGRALATLCADPRVAALTVTEFNPHHGAADGADTRRLIEVLAAAL